jgi:hypothetical protein
MMQGLAVAVEHLLRGAAAHVLAVVATPAVVGEEPGVGFCLELTDREDAAPVEAGLQHSWRWCRGSARRRSCGLGERAGMRWWRRPRGRHVALDLLGHVLGTIESLSDVK